MRRREFIALLCGAAAAWPFTARAQQPKMLTVGILTVGVQELFLSVFRVALRELGYVEGRTVALVMRSAEGRPEPLARLAAELAALEVDVAVAFQTPAVFALKQATRTIPIVMSSGDPVATGLVASLAAPGGNITGVSGAAAETAGKSVELARDLLPAASHVGVLANPTDPFTRPFLEQIRLVGQNARLDIRTHMIARAEDFDQAFAQMLAGQTDFVIHQPSLPQTRTIELARMHRLPSSSPLHAYSAQGGLMSYAARSAELYRRCAVLVDKILKGARPADLPVELPTRFDLVINLKTAKAIGLEVPPACLARADEVIE